MLSLLRTYARRSSGSTFLRSRFAVIWLMAVDLPEPGVPAVTMQRLEVSIASKRRFDRRMVMGIGTQRKEERKKAMMILERWYDSRSVWVQAFVLFVVHAIVFAGMMMGVGAALSTHGGGL